MSVDPRSGADRRRDTEQRLSDDRDVWVATASVEGGPYLVPLSFYWDGAALLLATPTASCTAVNLAATRTVRLGLGDTRDVIIIDADVLVLEIDELPDGLAKKYVAHTGWDPREAQEPCLLATGEYRVTLGWAPVRAQPAFRGQRRARC